MDAAVGWRRWKARPGVAYAVAAGLSALAFLVRPWVGTHLGADPALVLAMPVVVLSAWFGGFGPGLLAVLLVPAARVVARWLGGVETFGLEDPLRSAITVPTALVVCAAFEQVHRARRRAEQRAEQAETTAVGAQQQAAAQQRMQRLVDSSAVAIAFSSGGVITSANDAFLTLMGCSRDDLASGRINQATLVPEQERPVYARAKLELDETGRNGPFHARLQRPDGILVDVITSAGRLAPDDYCIFFTDISALTRAEEALRASQQRSEQVSERLREAVGSLREADRQKDNFIATLAHELRNPLAPIANGARLLMLKADDAKTVTWSAQAIERQVRQLTRLLDDLLDVSRISRNTLHLRRQRMRLQEAIELAVEQVRPFLDAQRHRLALQVPAEPLELLGDLARLTQVFANLLHNAAKYTLEPGLITLAAERRGEQLVVSVQDPGLGIAPQEQQRVFEMFSQAHTELRNAQPGLGIGLALVRGIVEIHGGSVQVASEGPGRGSRFTVALPALPASSEPASTGGGGDPLAGLAGYRVLVVDDNVDSAESIAALLSQCGNTVRCAYGGAAALALGPQFLPAVVLMDIGMPGMDGLQAAQAMRATPWGRAALLIAMTGYGQPEDKRRALQSGFDHHLTKPIDLETLGRCLRGD